MTWHVDMHSFFKGIAGMRRPHAPVKYLIRPNRGWWVSLWTPAWHAGRGPYVSLGLGCFVLYRGY